MADMIGEAFAAVPRRNFLPEDLADQADLDMPLPIGFGQTSSQPTTVAMMLEWLEVQPGDRVLDIGSGSGWTSALLSRLTGKKGRVEAVEIIPQLVEFGRDNCWNLGIENVHFHQAGKAYGWPAGAPYDRILVSAAASAMPKELFAQLKLGGRLIVPVKNAIYIVDKDEAGKITQREQPGFMFVPLVPGD